LRSLSCGGKDDVVLPIRQRTTKGREGNFTVRGAKSDNFSWCGASI
jgi:hypothetical protein